MMVIALTGGIGSGKSSVASQLAALGVPVIDTDEISHQLTAPGEAALAEIAQAFGPEVMSADGSLERAVLRRLVFRDEAARKRLEAILHPRIRTRMQELLAAVEAPYAVVAIPLLLETGQADSADRVLVVDLPEAEQVRRVRARSGLDIEEIRRIIASQAPRSARLARADDIIDNSGDQRALREQVGRLHRRFLRLAEAQSIESIKGSGPPPRGDRDRRGPA